ncbi:hypothetical protein [Thermonema sp.]|uniref:hypothetical protein n=1 Tax=Thermonema sp. TaxID=2231181 RepID=UPI00258FBB5F|nr:hypothetical protein [Thermonema sp.]
MTLWNRFAGKCKRKSYCLWMLSLFVSLCSGTPVAYGQFQELARYQYREKKRENKEFRVIPLQKKRAVLLYGTLFSPQKNLSGANQGYFFELLDEELRPRWDTTYALRLSWELQHVFLEGEEYFHLLFRRNFREYGVLSVQLDNGELQWLSTTLPTPLDVDEFLVFGKNAFLLGYYKRHLIGYDFSFFDASVKAIPKIYEKWLEPVSYTIAPQEFKAYIAFQYAKTKDCYLLLREFLSNGEMVSELSIPRFQERTFDHVRLLALPGKGLFMAGSYAFRCDDDAEGLAFGLIRKNAPPRLQYMPFVDFRHFYDYLPDRRQEKLSEKAERRQQNQKRKDNPKQHKMLLQQPIAGQQHIYLLGEVYRLNYRTSNNSNLNIAMRGRSVLSTYDYLHAHLFVFNHEGQYVDDYTMELDSEYSRSTQLKPMVRFVPAGKGFALLHPHKSGIHVKVMEGDSLVFEEKRVPYRKTYAAEEGQKIRPQDADAFFWYDDYFLLWFPYQEPLQFSDRPTFYLMKLKVVPPPPQDEAN